MDIKAWRIVELDARAPRLEASFRAPRAAIQFRRAEAEINHRKAVIANIYLGMVVKVIRDTFTALDAVAIVSRKGFGDTTEASDRIASIALQKALTDAIVTADGVSFKSGKSLADALATADAVSLTIRKNFADAVAVVDVVSANRTTGLYEALSLGDVASIRIGKSLAEVVALGENFALVMSPGVVPYSQLNGYPIGELLIGG